MGARRSLGLAQRGFVSTGKRSRIRPASTGQKLNSGHDPGRQKLAMNSEKTPLTNKLILVVLSLILVCLVLLVVRAYGPGLVPEPVPAVASVEMEVPPPVEASTPEPAPLRAA